MYHTTFKALILFAAVTAFVVTPASATLLGTVNIQNHSQAYSEQAQLWGGGLNGDTYYTGVYSWTNMGGTGVAPYVPNWGFCIELTEAARNGWQDVIPLAEAPLPSFPIYGTPMGVTKANYIRELWGRNFDPTWATGADREYAEAFSVCLWEIIYETDPTWDVTTGAGFRAGSIQQATTANLWLSQLTYNSDYFASGLVATDDGQDYIVQIPEPATLSLLAFGTATLLRRRRS
jgi:hypothetical protein